MTSWQSNFCKNPPTHTHTVPHTHTHTHTVPHTHTHTHTVPHTHIIYPIYGPGDGMRSKELKMVKNKSFATHRKQMDIFHICNRWWGVDKIICVFYTQRTHRHIPHLGQYIPHMGPAMFGEASCVQEKYLFRIWEIFIPHMGPAMFGEVSCVQEKCLNPKP